MAEKKLRVKVALECMREMDDDKIWRRYFEQSTEITLMYFVRSTEITLILKLH